MNAVLIRNAQSQLYIFDTFHGYAPLHKHQIRKGRVNLVEIYERGKGEWAAILTNPNWIYHYQFCIII